MKIYKQYLKDKDIWDSIFIGTNILFCFILIGILYTVVPQQQMVNPKADIVDEETSPDEHCQFSYAAFNPFVTYSALIYIYPTNSNDTITLFYSGSTITRNSDTFIFNDTPSYDMYFLQASNMTYYHTFTSSEFASNIPVYANAYEYDPYPTGYLWYPLSCIEDYFMNSFISFIQESFQADIFNPSLRPFLPVLRENFTSSFNQEVCDPTKNNVWDSGIWDDFMNNFSISFQEQIIDKLDIRYTCFEKESSIDYFMRLAAYSFLITLILLLIQFILNLYISFKFKSEIKEIRKRNKATIENTSSQ